MPSLVWTIVLALAAGASAAEKGKTLEDMRAFLPPAEVLGTTCTLRVLDDEDGQTPYLSASRASVDRLVEMWFGAGTVSNVQAVGYATYSSEGHRIGMYMYAFDNAEDADTVAAYLSGDSDPNEEASYDALVRHGKYLVYLWRNPSYTGNCFERIREHLDRSVRAATQ